MAFSPFHISLLDNSYLSTASDMPPYLIEFIPYLCAFSYY